MLSGKIKIVEYGPHEDPLGYMEPEGPNPSWILWWWRDGHADLYLERESTGAVKCEPIKLPAPPEPTPEEFLSAAFPGANLDTLEINARLVAKWLGEKHEHLDALSVVREGGAIRETQRQV